MVQGRRARQGVAANRANSPIKADRPMCGGGAACQGETVSSADAPHPKERRSEEGARPVAGTLSQLGLGELLAEVQERLEDIAGIRDRMDGLLEAVLAVSSGLELDATLRQIVHAAIE